MNPGPEITLLGAIAYALIATRISLFDVKHHLVRNKDLVIALAVTLLPAIAHGLSSGQWSSLLSGVMVGATYAAILSALTWLGRGQLGSGDVGLGVVLGLFLGTYSIPASLIGLATPFALAALPSALVWWKSGRKSELAFAPFLLFSAPVTLLIASLAW